MGRSNGLVEPLDAEILQAAQVPQRTGPFEARAAVELEPVDIALPGKRRGERR